MQLLQIAYPHKQTGIFLQCGRSVVVALFLKERREIAIYAAICDFSTYFNALYFLWTVRQL